MRSDAALFMFNWIPKMQKCVNLVDLVSFQTSFYLQNLASIQRRTGLSEFAKIYPTVRNKLKKYRFNVAFAVIAIGLAAPLLLLHYLDFRRNFWRLGGRVRTILQESLMQRVLYYNEENRARVSSADLIMCLTHDVLELAHCGFTAKFQRTSSSYRFF